MTLLEALELANYKIGEMLMTGMFEDNERENFQRARDKIGAVIEQHKEQPQ